MSKSIVDGRNHVAVSLRDKLNSLMAPAMFRSLVLVQQHELEGIKALAKIDKNRANIVYIEQLYQHYVVEAKGKTYLQN